MRTASRARITVGLGRQREKLHRCLAGGTSRTYLMTTSRCQKFKSTLGADSYSSTSTPPLAPCATTSVSCPITSKGHGISQNAMSNCILRSVCHATGKLAWPHSSRRITCTKRTRKVCALLATRMRNTTCSASIFHALCIRRERKAHTLLTSKQNRKF